MFHCLKNKILIFLFLFLLIDNSICFPTTKIIENEESHYSFWVDLNIWTVIAQKKQPEINFLFLLEEPRIYGNFLVKEKEIESSSFSVRDFFLEKVDGMVGKRKILLEEEKKVNEMKVQYIQLTGKAWFSSFIFDAYLYENEKLFLIVCVAARNEAHSMYWEMIQRFLNGLCL